MKTLSRYEIDGIQAFAYGSRLLRANLGASWLVHTALNGDDGWLSDLACAHHATVLWSGGGNAMVESESLNDAQSLATALSARLLEKAPGLLLACAHLEWDGSKYESVAHDLAMAVGRQKEGRLGDANFDGGGVCEPCRDTGRPAVPSPDPQPNPLAMDPSIAARLFAHQDAKTRLEQLLGGVIRGASSGATYTWTDNIDELGRTRDDESVLGVIHIDGNELGRHFRSAAGNLFEIKELARQVNEWGEATLKDGFKWLRGVLDDNKQAFELNDAGDSKQFFPARPVLFGGDDITLICDGRLALDLAAELLCAWHRHARSRQLHACAGVALVRPHYPFYRAVEQAHALCKRAKQWLKAQQLSASALHWSLHRAGGPEVVSELALTARPYVVAGALPRDLPWRCWRWFRKDCIAEFQRIGKKHQSQLKALGDPLSRGPSTAEAALERLYDRHGLRLPSPVGKHLEINGRDQGEGPYLDALEIMDLLTLPNDAVLKGAP